MYLPLLTIVYLFLCIYVKPSLYHATADNCKGKLSILLKSIIN